MPSWSAIAQSGVPLIGGTWNGGLTGSCGTVTRFSVAATTGTSANVSTVTLGTGDQVLVSASEGSGGSGYEHISSVTGQTGYIIPFWGWSYAGSGFAGGGTSWYYIPSASGITSATLTVNDSTSRLPGPRIFVIDIPNAAGTASIDAISTYSLGDNTNASLTQAPITTSGTNDCVVGFAAFSNSVSSPWNTNFTDLGGSTQGASSTTWLSNITSSPSTPVWANSNGNGMGAVGEFALGYNVTASLPYCLMDSSGGTNTVLPTVATVAASTFGCSVGPGSGGGASNFTFTVNDNSSSLTYATAAHHALLNPAWRFLYSGATYSDSNTLGVAIATVNSSQSTSIQMTLPGNLNSNFFYLINPTVTQSVDFYTTVLGSDNLGPVHIFTEGTPSGDGPNIAVQTTGGNLEFLCEPGGFGELPQRAECGHCCPSRHFVEHLVQAQHAGQRRPDLAVPHVPSGLNHRLEHDHATIGLCLQSERALVYLRNRNGRVRAPDFPVQRWSGDRDTGWSPRRWLHDAPGHGGNDP